MHLMRLKKYPVLLIVALTFAITYLHYSAAVAVQTLHNIYRELYYIPVLLAALAYGLRGALLSYLLVFALYLPYVIMTWPGSALNETNRLLPLLLQGLFAMIAGYLVDRERKQRAQLEQERYLADIGRITTVIVHDLKNPLVAIAGFARRIREGKGRTENAATVIMEATEQMENIVTSVLDFSKPVYLDFKRLDIRDLVQRAGDSCRMRGDQRSVALSIDLPSLPVNGWADTCQLERALVNLILNGIDASERGQSVSISMTAHGHELTIRIADQGSGMTTETLEHIFVPFYTKKPDGTGLGMPIAKKIVEAHGGKIHVSSTPAHGTVVAVELPLEGRDKVIE
ncbi:MAG TPA: HAMP domain-containing sensor histidine kinase [Nitrospirota bacterium]|nr:HAMP domain-containing sensor histidine kinase [Nitrospirota bacterium]